MRLYGVVELKTIQTAVKFENIMYGVVVIADQSSLQAFHLQCQLENVTISDIIQSNRESGTNWFIFIDGVYEFEHIRKCRLWAATVRFFTMEELCARSITLGLPHPTVFSLTNSVRSLHQKVKFFISRFVL